jgi:hypothetical protein
MTKEETATAQDLLRAIKAVERCAAITKIVPDHIKAEDGSYDPSLLHPLVQRVQMLADSVLITEKGDCDWANIQWLALQGVHVRRGSGDSFGWLSGVIPTSKGDILYG